jgi:uncharacterized coiled-coil protein SlyX
LKSTIAQQQKEIQTLMATVREQSAQIQKVSARLEASNAVSQTAFNDREGRGKAKLKSNSANDR